MGRGPRRNEGVQGGAEPGSRPSPYNEVEESHRQEQAMEPVSSSNLGQALAEKFGTSARKGAIAKRIGSRSLQALGASAGVSMIFGTPLLPVAGIAVGGYMAAKGVGVWRAKRRMDAEDARAEQGHSPQASGEYYSDQPNYSDHPGDISSEQLPPESYPERQDTPPPDVPSEEERAEAEEAARKAAEERDAEIERLRAEREAQLQSMTDSVRELIRSEAVTSLDEEIEEELRTEGMHRGKDYGEKPDPEAVQARKLMFSVGSVPVSPEEKDAVVKGISSLEAGHLEKGQLKERLAALKAQETATGKEAAAAEKQRLADLRADVKAQAAQKKEELLFQKQEKQNILRNFESNIHMLTSPESIQDAEAKMDTIQQEIAAIDQAIASIPEEEKHVVEQNSEAIRQHTAAQKEAILAEIAAEREALLSKEIGDIDGLVNLTTASGGEIVCRRCKTRPKTVRRRCSRCGAPFVIDHDHQQYIGRSEDELRSMGVLDTLEKHEGDSEIRAQKWAEWRDGVRVGVPKSSAKKATLTNPVETTEETPVPAKAPSPAQEASNPTPAISTDLHQGMQPSGEFERSSYLLEQKAKRDGANPERACHLVGHHSKKGFGDGGPNAALSQPDAMLQGVMGWDWSTGGKNVKEGDRIFIRRNGTKPVEIAGFFTAGEQISLQLPKVPEAVANASTEDKLAFLEKNHPETFAALNETVDRVMGGMDPEFYGRERVLDSILLSLGKSNKTINFSQVLDPQTLDGYTAGPALGGNMKAMGIGSRQLNGEKRFKKLNEDAETAEEAERLMQAADEKSADTVESNSGSYPGEGFGLDAKGQPRLCKVKTAAGTACQNYATRGADYCWQHQNGPNEKAGETALSQSELEASAKETMSGGASNNNSSAQNQNQASPQGKRVPIGRDKAEAFINAQNNDPAQSETYPECGMTEQELARYANSFLEACNPKEDEAVGVNIVFESQRPYARAIENLAIERGMEVIAWYPDSSDAATADRIREKQNAGKLITGWVDQVGDVGERIQGAAAPFDGQRWNITLTPTREWAELLAHNSDITGFSSDPDEALRQLAQDIQDFTYADQGISGLRDHIDQLEARAQRIEDLGIKKLRIQDPSTGTDLSMEMAPKSKWMTVDMPSGVKNPEGNQDDVLANTVTEEVWGTPLPGSLQGTFTSSAPLNLNATAYPDAEPLIIESISGRFENGELVELQAYKKDADGNLVEDAAAQEAMEQFFFGPGGRPIENGRPAPFPQCGEIGLVDSDNPVASSGRNYLIPVIDEHGGLHIAIGDSYELNGGGKNNECSYTGEGTPWVKERHVDITIGTKGTTVTGIDADGQESALIEGGSWLI